VKIFLGVRKFFENRGESETGWGNASSPSSQKVEALRIKIKSFLISHVSTTGTYSIS